MTEFICNVCATELTTEQIQIEKKYKIDVAFVICPDCDNRFNLMYDNKQTIAIKNKIKKIKEIENYLQLVLYKEMLIAEDEYLKQTYNDLPEEEKEKIGEYVSNIDKHKIKEYDAAIKAQKYSVKDLAKLI